MIKIKYGILQGLSIEVLINNAKIEVLFFNWFGIIVNLFLNERNGGMTKNMLAITILFLTTSIL